MSQAIILEDSSKKKRGRPGVYIDGVLKSAMSSGNCKTTRGAHEWLLLSRAYCQIRKTWETDKAGNAWAEGFYIDTDHSRGLIFHRSILAALGRIEDDEDRLATAKIIAERRLSTKAAVTAIRRTRLGREDKPDFFGLVECIETAINSYLSAHPSTPMNLIVRALREYAETIN